MKRMVIGVVLAGLALGTARADQGRSAKTPQYQKVAAITIGGDGGWDFLTVEPTTKRLYAPHANFVAVIDLEKDAVVGRVDDTPGAHGFLAIPALDRGFSSNGSENTSTMVELSTLRVIKKIRTGENPDAMLYDPAREEVYTFNADRAGTAYSATVIAARTGNVVATIPMPGKPELAALDPAAGRIYSAIQDKNVVVAIDTATHAIVANWPTAPGAEATGLAIDTKSHRLFVGCGNGKLILMDSRNGAVLDTAPTGTGNDGVEFDAATGLIFSAETEGTLTILQVASDGRLKVVQTLRTPWRSKTMALDPVTHKIYVASGLYQPLPPSKPGEATPKPIPVSGSFTVLVFGPASR
ncbi:MAG TPA: hypothetical protein VGK32_22425 [Vicinamibacterales bacterium]|jgi:hypothetical protein